MPEQTKSEQVNDDDAIRELARQVRTLEGRIADVDFWLRFSKWSGITLVVVVGATVVVLGWLLSFKASVDNAAGRVSSLTTSLTDDEGLMDRLTKRMNGLDNRIANFQNHEMDEALTGRANKLAADQHPANYSWDDYKADIQELANLGQEYLFRISENPSWDGNGTVMDALTRAVRRVENRVDSGMPKVDDTNTDKGKSDIVGHKAAPRNFENYILAKIQQDRTSGHWDSAHLACYQDAIPVWQLNIGVYPENTANSKSLYCQRLLGLPDCYDSQSKRGAFCTKAEL